MNAVKNCGKEISNSEKSANYKNIDTSITLNEENENAEVRDNNDKLILVMHITQYLRFRNELISLRLDKPDMVTNISIGYYICAKERMFRDGGTHIMFAILFMIIGVFFNTVIAATTITSDRHSQNWPLL